MKHLESEFLNQPNKKRQSGYSILRRAARSRSDPRREKWRPMSWRKVQCVAIRPVMRSALFANRESAKPFGDT